MLTAPQQALIQAIEELDLEQVQRLLNEGLDPNFIDPEKGPPISVVCDGLFQWWEDVQKLMLLINLDRAGKTAKITTTFGDT